MDFSIKFRAFVSNCVVLEFCTLWLWWFTASKHHANNSNDKFEIFMIEFG